jgi:ubiquitin-conjugating enzyme E2 W
MFYGSLIANLY